jgi:DNA-directed RNA polymerase specialized sigma24 family protein
MFREGRTVSEAGSVSRWLNALQAGNQAAAQPLWERYFQRLVGLARARLRDAPRRTADEEDVALSAFDSFCRAAAAGRFPDLHDREGLWRLLMQITAHKATDQRRRAGRQKRGGAVTAEGLDEAVSREPSPEFASQVAEECRRLLDRLDDAGLVAVALEKMAGATNEEIAAQKGCVVRTVERKLRLIRSVWARELTP